MFDSIPLTSQRLQNLHFGLGVLGVCLRGGKERSYRWSAVIFEQCRLQRGSTGAGLDDMSRAECLRRYQDKKRRRHMYKQIRYHKRKVNADNRWGRPQCLPSRLAVSQMLNLDFLIVWQYATVNSFCDNELSERFKAEECPFIILFCHEFTIAGKHLG